MRIFQVLGIVGPVRAGLLYRSVYWLATAITCLLVVTALSAVEQGYFFTFVGILGAQQLLELGLSLVIMQVASHESAGVTWHGRRASFAKSDTAARLGALLAGSLRWYAGIAAAFLVAVVPAGWLVLSGDDRSGVGDAWQRAWLFAGAMTAVNLIPVPVVSVLEGSGRMGEVFAFRTWQELTASFGLWCALLLGLGLDALGVYFALRAVSGLVYVVLYRGLLAQLLSLEGRGGGFAWSREIWPLQWRIAFSWGTGYLIFQLTTPIVFAVIGPVAAGQWSLTYLALYMIGQFWLIWVSARGPELGSLAARRSYREMEAIFVHGATRSAIACAIGIALAYAALRLAFDLQLPHADRFMEPAGAAILMAWALVNHGVNLIAVYLRAHREEPLLLPSIAGGILIPPAVYLAGGAFGMTGIAASYLVVGCVTGLGWGGFIFWRKLLACRIVAT